MANESGTAVWFDEMSITHTPTLIAQETHYDPWGLELVGIGAQGYNRFTFNAQSEKQKELGGNTGYFFETDWRGYDAQVGRFWQVDKLAGKYSGVSPYAFAFNNPIRFADPTGLAPPDSIMGHQIGEEVVLTGTRSKETIADNNGNLIPKGLSNAKATPNLNISQPIHTINPKAPIQQPKPSIIKRIGNGLAIGTIKALSWLARNGGLLVSFLLTPSSLGTDDIPKHLPSNAVLTNAEQDRLNELNTKYTTGQQLTSDEAYERDNLLNKSLGGGDHHIATNKNEKGGQQYTLKLKPFFDNADLNIDTEKTNRVWVIGHKGGHEDEYHETILERLNAATRGLTSHTPEYTEAVKEALKTAGKEIIKDGTQMNKWTTVRKGSKK